MSKHTPISICIICKNEEKHISAFLGSIISHMADYPYEIIITDTGSTDNTLNIIDQVCSSGHCSCKLCTFKWVNDFSAARNFSLDQASYDWVLVLDCDEYVEEVDTACFDLMAAKYPRGVGMLSRKNHQSQNGIDNIFTDQVERLFNRRYFHYEAIVHEQVRLRPEYASLTERSDNPHNLAANELFSRTAIPLTVDHCGYAGSPEEIAGKAKRNTDLLLEMLKSDPDDPYIYFQLGQSYNMIHDDENAALYFGKGLEFDVDPDAEYVQMMVEAYGYNLIHLERYDEALQFANIEDVFGKTAEFAVLMGLIYLRKGMLLQAMTEFLKATTYETCRTEGANSFIPYFNMGCINEVVGNTADALALYKKCGNFPQALERIRELS